MVLENKQTTVAYRCPSCGCAVTTVVDAFRLSADMVKLRCECGQSEMSIVKGSDGKVRFTVPCVICPNPHSYTVSTSLFYGKEIFVLGCPYSDISLCAMGESNHVKAEMARGELELLDMLEQSGIDSFEALRGAQDYLTDPQVLQIVSYVIKELDDEGKIYCRCPEGEEGNYEIEMTPEGLLVRCLKCGARAVIPTNSIIQATEFLGADNLTLE